MSGEAVSEAFGPVAELAGLSQAVAALRREVSASGAIDLSGLEERVEHLCREIAAWATEEAGEGEGGEVRQAMRALIQGLDALAVELGARQRELMARLEAVEGADGAPGQPSGGG